MPEAPSNSAFPRPAVPSNQLQSMELWMMEHLPHKLRDEDGEQIRSAKMHRQFIYLWEHPEIYPKTVWIAPRHFAKSVLGKAGILYDAVHKGPQHFREHLIIKASEELAKRDIQELKEEITNNDSLNKRYGSLSTQSDREKRWSALEINLANGVTIVGRGHGGSMRGLHPQSVMADDIEKEDSSTGRISQEVLAGISRWLRKSVIPMLPPKRKRLFWMGNVVQSDSLLYRAYQGKDVANASWMRILNSCYDENRNSTWPERFTNEQLAEMEADMGYNEFMCELVGAPLGSLNPLVLQEWIRYFEEPEVSPKMYIVMGFDPARSLKQQADFSAFCIVGADVASNAYQEKYFVLDCGQGHWDLDTRVRRIIDLCKRYQVDVLRIENNGFQDDMVVVLEKEMNRQNIFMGIDRVRRGPGGMAKDKYTALDSLTPLIKSGKTVFRKSQTDLIEQLTTFPTSIGGHDDLVDAFTLALDAMKANYVAVEKRYDQRFNPGAFHVKQPAIPELGL